MSAIPAATNGASHPAVVPSEVGWQFVPQYYTFVNKEPGRLHCFYNKNSTFIHGTEGEDIKPCFGQKGTTSSASAPQFDTVIFFDTHLFSSFFSLHNAANTLLSRVCLHSGQLNGFGALLAVLFRFEDCKVFIHSVDAQSSANGGIIIQVIGEMSNRSEAWRKFVQTFFLAEQPNGYFVLNDIFRFLKEETVDSDDLEAEDVVESDPAPTAVPEPVAPVAVAVPEPVYEPVREPSPAPAPVEVAPPAPVPVVEEAPATPEPVPEPVITQTPTPAPEQQAQPTVSVPQTNGIHTPEPEAAPAPVAAPEPAPSPAPAPAAAAPTPVAAPPQPAPVAAPAPAPQPAAPAAPRSWAALAASNTKKWGSAVATESRGTTEVLSQPAPAAAPQAAAPAPAQQRQQQNQQQRHEHPALVAAQSVTHAQCFVKGVTEPVTQSALQTVLTHRFGPIKEVEIVRAKACAFLEFNSVESARRAIAASLNQHQGGEGGVWVDGGDAGQIRISIETKKERADRPAPRPRGGAPVNGEARGGAQGSGFRGGRGGARGARGGAQAAK
ncbi:hypothetical protein D9619_008061 [Psilocybe cf. subviscida]|uniref:NTF2 domain-containing protein n=1 Tax=Psilocybe cf. subviscida TaxID=2480587 RepID=A0A8H5ESJ7_9AGAR|nr:hypothetical protein D9619_008061 [Psilocybe cf. subviscida]